MAVSASELSSAVTAGVSVAGLLGSGIAFLWVRVEWNNKKIKDELRHCEERGDIGREHRATLTTVLELVWAELARVAPNAKIFKRAKVLMDQLKIDQHDAMKKDNDL